MKKIIQAVVAVVVMANITGCATPYMTDRARDVADILSIGIGTGLGAKARIGPLHAGLILHWDQAGLRGGQFLCSDLGFTASDIGGDCEAPFPLFPSRALVSSEESLGPTYKSVQTDLVMQRYKTYMTHSKPPFVTTYFLPYNPFYVNKPETTGNYLFHPYWTQIDILGDVIVGFRLGFNPGELLDFILGLTTIDIFDDDLEARKQKEEKSNKVQQDTR